MKFNDEKSFIIRIFACILIILSLSINSLFAQSWLWAKRAGGTNNDNSTAIVTDVKGNVYTTGYFSSNKIVFGSDTLVNADSGTADIFIAKYDATGNVLWAKSAGGTGWDYSQSIASDNTGSTYITGYFGSPTISFGTDTFTNTGYSDVYLVKYDSVGNIKWATHGGGNYFNYSYSVFADNFGHVYMTGKYGSAAMHFGGMSLPNVGQENIFIVKYDTAGNLIWAKSSGGNGSDNALNLKTDNAGNIYVTGYFDGDFISFGGTSLLNDSVAGTKDMFLAKLDTAGNIVWLRGALGMGDAEGASLATDDSGYVYVAGNYNYNIIFNSDTLLNAGGGTSDIFFAKFDTASNYLWARRAGGVGEDVVQSVAIDVFHNFYLTGYFSSPTLTFGSFTLTNAGMNDMFFARLNYDGNAYAAVRAGGTENDFGVAVAIDTAGKIYMTGNFLSNTISFGSATLTNASGSLGYFDLFVARYFDPIVYVEPVLAAKIGANLYPNPTNGKFNVSLTAGEVNNITIYDCMGRLVYDTKIKDGSSSCLIDLTGKEEGIYYMSISNSKSCNNIAFEVRK